MTKNTSTALAKIRAKLGLSRLDPRRLYIVDDGAYCWIGDRADLSTADARALRAIDSAGGNPANDCANSGWAIPLSAGACNTVR